MRLIDADVLWEWLNNEPWFDNADRDEIALPIVNAIPTVDAEVVVHCKDCKQLQCCNVTQFLGVDGYCSYGEYKCNTEGIKWQTKR